MDDEPYIGRIVRMQFERGPFAVAVAYDADGALAHLAEHPDTDCVLLDLHLPDRPGLSVLEAIRADARLRALPVVVVTAAGEQQHVERARELGVSAIVTKPFSPKKLYRQVAGLLGVDTGAPPDEA